MQFLRTEGAARRAIATGGALLALSAAGCNLDKTLNVEDVDVATPGSVNSAAGLPVVYAGARSEFQNMFTSTDGAVTLPGLLADELRDIDTFPTRIEVDQRMVQETNGTVQGWYRNMHRARAALERALDAFAQFAPNDPRRAELYGLNGLLYVMFAEDWCNGVAYSSYVGGQEQYGSPTSGAKSLARAVAQFDSGLAIAAANSQERRLNQVGKGRALVDLNNYSGAAAAVAGVPADFQYLIYTSENSGRENNGIYVNISTVSKRFAVADKDGVNGLAFRTEGQTKTGTTGDPRIRYEQNGIGQDGQSVAYYQLKYPSRSAPVVLASGIEAKLIIAENLIKTGDATYVDTLNALRANTALINRVPYTQAGLTAAAALPALVDPGSTPARVDQLFHERAFWLYLSGHRLGDLRRLASQYGRPVESVFPTGTYQGAAGGTIGPDVNFPIPIDEKNNASAPACTDRAVGFGS